MEPKFNLGKTVITPGAKESISEQEVMHALHRHERGDWGLVGIEDREENDLSLEHNFRLISVYRARNGTKFWIITEADRSATTVLLPEEY